MYNHKPARRHTLLKWLSLLVAIAALCVLCWKVSTTIFRASSKAHEGSLATWESYTFNDAGVDEDLKTITNSSEQEESMTTEGSSGSFASVISDTDTTSDTETSDELRARLNISETYYADLDHGPKGVEYQRYIVLHDTEGDSRPANTLEWWESNGNLIAAHFIVDRDGSILQCVPLERIAHHAGYGDAGHNDFYGIVEDGRDDMAGTTPIGSWAPDYGMNAWSIGIEMVHVGGGENYTEAQLDALDDLIAYIDAYFAEQGQTNPSTIIDHKAWRSGNSDTSSEFSSYLANYQDHRSHD